ncbi:hypothetical protein [Actinoplanes sp. M2I2]|uniref:hypothetical protein n=1 Tax=Actinoplanes sp. M2I2 TaxID=1734444 RepID=UPI0020211553|nr:hypothetical protein [Actinoplanes sp. M2I2]
MARDDARTPVRELLQVLTMWFGWGEPEPGDGAAPAGRRAGYLLVQTVAAVVLGLLAALIFLGVRGGPVPVGWPAPYVALFVPLAIAVARRPADAPLPLAAGLVAGALIAAVVLVALPGSGFWLWFGALAAGSLAAGAVFGAIAGRRPDVPA